MARFDNFIGGINAGVLKQDSLASWMAVQEGSEIVDCSEQQNNCEPRIYELADLLPAVLSFMLILLFALVLLFVFPLVLLHSLDCIVSY